MEIIFVIIGITCSILLIGIGVLIGVGTNISKFFEASLPMFRRQTGLWIRCVTSI